MPVAPFAIVALEGGAALILPDSVFTERQRLGIAHMIANRGVDPLPASPPVEPRPPMPAGAAVIDQAAASPSDTIRRKALAEAARGQGFTGDTCTRCGSASMKRNGSCLCCAECGETTGCS